MVEITNRLYDADLLMGGEVRWLWNELGEKLSFEERVVTAERFLLRKLNGKRARPAEDEIATFIFRRKGAVTMGEVAKEHRLGQRQLERRFREETGTSPKVFARVARFQSALDAKLASPGRAWIDIAHDFGYYDQMHMVHDFEKLGDDTPTQLIRKMGDVRPPALVTAEREVWRV